MYIEKPYEIDFSNKTISLSIMIKVAIFLTILALTPLSYASGINWIFTDFLSKNFLPAFLFENNREEMV
jgi:hypothetical protein